MLDWSFDKIAIVENESNKENAAVPPVRSFKNAAPFFRSRPQISEIALNSNGVNLLTSANNFALLNNIRLDPQK
jgi:hypothetical protein